jgi:hypothetical protein
VISAHTFARSCHGVPSRTSGCALYARGVLVRALVISGVVLGAGCKKKEREMATELPSTPSSGHSVTHFKDAPEAEGSAEVVASGSPPAAIDAAEAPKSSGAQGYRDPDGRIHGPGGPVNMGSGPNCDAEHNHCQRGDAWFFANNVVPGKLYRATACFEFEGKWYTWRGDEVEKGGKLFRTRVAKPEDLQVGKPIVFFAPESDPRDKWVDSEYEGLTSSRWDVGVPETVNPAAKTWGTRAWPDPIDDDVARAIVETKDY